MSFPYLSDAVRAFTGLDLPIPLPTFGLCVAGATLVAMHFFRHELHRQHAPGSLGNNTRALDPFVSHFVFVVLLSGILGARFFHLLEHLNEFIANPWPMIFSRSGLSIMGGLIFGALAGLVVTRRSGFPIPHVLDAVAPALMLGYGLGRIGCQISGDGDWGIAANMALKPDWLPTWVWAQTYENNIYGVVLPAPGVYPTPLYEMVMALLLFAVLWGLRRHPFRKGYLFALYLVLAGAERLLIEQIRVNPVFGFLGLRTTQAELIASVFLVLGLVGIATLRRRVPHSGQTPTSNP